jgi:hypothetical protein
MEYSRSYGFLDEGRRSSTKVCAIYFALYYIYANNVIVRNDKVTLMEVKAWLSSNIITELFCGKLQTC